MRQQARRKNSLLLLLVFLTGFMAGSFYSFAVYPSFRATFRADIDPDFYGLLGRNIRAGKGLTFFSDDGPTAFRGPFYPGFIALSLSLTAGWFPGGLWLMQSLLHGLTCLMVFFVSGKLWNRRAAFAAAFVYALYPAVLWHVPRIWNEILLSFLMSCLLFLGLTFLEKPSPAKAVGMGIVLASLCLTKAIFLPFLVFFPGMLLVIGSHRILKHSLLLIIVAVLLIAPWTIRNYRLSGRFIPVHTGIGGNLKRGNLIAREFFRHPFSYRALFEITNPEMIRIKKSVQGTQLERDIRIDSLMKASALLDIRQDPSLLLRKAAAAGTMFWFVGDTPAKTMVLLLLRLPVLVLFVWAAFTGLRAGQVRHWLAAFIVVFFWLLHLSFAPNARLSVPLLPILIVYASGTVLLIPSGPKKVPC